MNIFTSINAIESQELMNYLKKSKWQIRTIAFLQHGMTIRIWLNYKDEKKMF